MSEDRNTIFSPYGTKSGNLDRGVILEPNLDEKIFMEANFATAKNENATDTQPAETVPEAELEVNAFTYEGTMDSNSSTIALDSQYVQMPTPTMTRPIDYPQIKIQTSVAESRPFPANLKSKKSMPLVDPLHPRQLSCPACEGVGLSKVDTRANKTATVACVSIATISGALAVLLHPTLCLASCCSAVPLYFGYRKPKLKCIRCESVFEAA